MARRFNVFFSNRVEDEELWRFLHTKENREMSYWLKLLARIGLAEYMRNGVQIPALPLWQPGTRQQDPPAAGYPTVYRNNQGKAAAESVSGSQEEEKLPDINIIGCERVTPDNDPFLSRIEEDLADILESVESFGEES